MPTPRVLVLSATAGEPQLEAMKRSLAEQRGVTVSHEIIEGLGLDAAMGEVHRRARSAIGRADWVLKLDGDMVPVADDSVSRLVAKAEALGCARFTTPVADSFTARQINGVHIFRPEAVPPSRPIVEHRPDHWITTIPVVVWRRVLNPQVLHAPNPDPMQALRFGLQRGTKARIDGARCSHWGTVADVARAARRDGGLALRSALAGAWVGLGLHPDWPEPSRDIVDRRSEAFQRLVEQARDGRLIAALQHSGFEGRGAVWAAHAALYSAPWLTVRWRAAHHAKHARPWIGPLRRL